MRRAALPVLAVLLATAGCGSAPSTHTAAPVPAASASQWDPTKMPDPCRVISRAEVTGAVGTGVSPGVRLQTWPPLCRFVIDQSTETFVYVSDDSRPTAVDDFQRNAHTTNVTRPVSGLGDQAYWLPEAQALRVLGGGTELVVMFRGGRVPADAQDAAVRLARIALPRARP